MISRDPVILERSLPVEIPILVNIGNINALLVHRGISTHILLIKCYRRHINRLAVISEICIHLIITHDHKIELVILQNIKCSCLAAGKAHSLAYDSVEQLAVALLRSKRNTHIENALKKYLPESVIENKVEDNPSDEVLEFDAVSSDAGDSTGSSLTIARARSVGLNVDAGLGYACGEEDFYLELLTDYLNCTSDKCAELTSYLENNDLKNYEVLVHSIKSASKTIGADDLSEQAKELEAAAKNNDMDFVKANHGSLVNSFKELAGKLADQ